MKLYVLKTMTDRHLGRGRTSELKQEDKEPLGCERDQASMGEVLD